MTAAIAIPPERFNPQGEPRRVGVELEFAGVSVAEASRLVLERFAGTAERRSPYHCQIRNMAFGDFTVTLDAQVIHELAADSAGNGRPGEFEERLQQTIGRSVEGLVPVEIVFPPLPWDRLDCLNELFEDLRRCGAEGTQDHLLNSFGLHLNPELAALDSHYILRHLRAFLILRDWLRGALEIDITRRLLPHIDPFPRDYAITVLDSAYEPEMPKLIDDYVAANPTRNRELDLLPLFRFIDEERVTSQLDSSLVKPRPTFHYRLPNSSLSVPGWNAVVEWNRWVKVERLAADSRRLADASQAWREHLLRSGPLYWLDEILEWLSG